nr:MAG TPA: hypothetical protein [Caudoviricetes sp.]
MCSICFELTCYYVVLERICTYRKGKHTTTF